MTEAASSALLTYGPLGIGWVIAILSISWLVKKVLEGHARELAALERMTKEASAIATASTSAQMAQSAAIAQLTQSVKDLSTTVATQGELVRSLTQSVQFMAMRGGGTPKPFPAPPRDQEGK